MRIRFSDAKWAEKETDFGWQCLVTRRFVERGVRFIEVIDVLFRPSEVDVRLRKQRLMEGTS